jgi:hypothetical protein
MVADDEVLQYARDLDREAFEPRHVALENLQSQPHVTHELPARRVAQAPRCPKLLDLADVVQDGTSNQEVPIESRVMFNDFLGQSAQGGYMVQQSTAAGVMETHAPWCNLDGRCHRWITQNRRQ